MAAALSMPYAGPNEAAFLEAHPWPKLGIALPDELRWTEMKSRLRRSAAASLHGSHRAHARSLGRALLVLLAGALMLGGGCPGAGGPQIGRLPALTSPNPKAEADLDRARRLEEQGKHEGAEKAYREFLRSYPRDPLQPIAELRLGRILLERGEHNEAFTLFESVTHHPDSTVAEQGRFYRAIAHHRLGEHAAAEKVLSAMVGRTVDPTDTELLLEALSASLIALDRSAQAVSALDRYCKEGLTEKTRKSARQRLTNVVREKATSEDIEQLYDDLPKDGCAFPEVARRAARDADAAADPERASEVLDQMRELSLPIDDELAAIAMRADRPAEADPNVVGAVLSLSGRGRRVSELALRGLMLAAGLPPKGPTAPGAPSLVFRDDGGDPARAREAITELATVHRAIAIIGPLDATAAEAASEQAAELGVPLILLAPAGPGAAYGPVVHRFFPTPEAEVTALLERASMDGATRIAALLPTSGYGDAFEGLLRKGIEARGLELVSVQRYAPGATAFGKEVAVLERARPEAVLLADGSSTLASIAPALAAGGLWSSPKGEAPPGSGRPIRLLVPSVAFDPELARSVGRYLQGAVFSVPFHAGVSPAHNPSASTFGEAFTAQFGEAPDAFAAFGHDAYKLVRRAVAAGAKTRKELLTELLKVRLREHASPSAGLSSTREAARPTRLFTLRGESFEPLQ
jgi:ABC-type branched-subunit amino acid transport system substrate-binding protein/predicted negative regulator of RcsB-dependent stress response